MQTGGVSVFKFGVRLFLPVLLLELGWLGFTTSAPAADAPVIAPATRPVIEKPGEKVPSDDPLIKNLHSLGLVNGHLNIFRSASPVRDLANTRAAIQDSASALEPAKARMKILYDLGIRTVISYEHPLQDGNKPDSVNAAQVQRSIDLEKAAAEALGMTFLWRPMSNSGKDSFEDMSDEEAARLLQSSTEEIFKCAKTGGVVFHCTGGHDRTGIVAAYIRLAYQHWPIDPTLAELREYGHEFVRFSSNGGISSWHEDHLRAIAKLPQPTHDTAK